MAASTVHSTDVLFLAYDQGESNAFIRIQGQLEKRDIPYKIIAFGRAAEIFRHHPALLHIKGITDNPDLRRHRGQKIPVNAVQRTTRSIQAKIIYSGMASRVQAQLMNAYGAENRRLIAFYDNFDPVGSKEYVQPFLEEVNRVDEFHLPSTMTASGFTSLEQSKRAKAVVTGQPVLESWDEVFDTTEPDRLRKKMAIPANQAVILFAGGYDSDYSNSFRIFLKATKLMPEVLFLVTHHPKYTGDLEQKLMDEEAVAENVRLLHNNQASTPQLSTLARAVVVHKSTIAQQALYKGKPVVYVADNQFSNFILEKQLASRVYSPEELKKVLSGILSLKQVNTPSLSALGVPDHASRNIADALEKSLKTQDHSQ